MGLTKDEFWSMTPTEFYALRYRQEVEFRHQCFAAALIAADYRNAHGMEVSPFDFLVCEEMSEEEAAKQQEEDNRAAIQRMMGFGSAKEKLN